MVDNRYTKRIARKKRAAPVYREICIADDRPEKKVKNSNLIEEEYSRYIPNVQLLLMRQKKAVEYQSVWVAVI